MSIVMAEKWLEHFMCGRSRYYDFTDDDMQAAFIAGLKMGLEGNLMRYMCTQCGAVTETPEPVCNCNAPITVDMSADMAGMGGM